MNACEGFHLYGNQYPDYGSYDYGSNPYGVLQAPKVGPVLNALQSIPILGILFSG